MEKGLSLPPGYLGSAELWDPGLKERDGVKSFFEIVHETRLVPENSEGWRPAVATHGDRIRRENNSRQPATLPPCGLAKMNKIPMTN